jgi:hypothetical protein
MPLHLAELKKHTEQNEKIIALLEKLVEGRENNEVSRTEIPIDSQRTRRNSTANTRTKNRNIQPRNGKGDKRSGRNTEPATL